MKETKFPASMLRSYTIEIFGSQEHKQPLILKNLSQKTKFHLRRLGEEFHKKEKEVIDQVVALRGEYFDDVEDDGKKSKRIKEGKEDEFKQKLGEIDGIEIPILHYEFSEADFIDRDTKEVVGSENIYFNIIDKLIYDTENQ